MEFVIKQQQNGNEKVLWSVQKLLAFL